MLQKDGQRPRMKTISDYRDDTTGESTITVLKNALQVVQHITSNKECSLGLHPAVYFYNERGKYNRFLFLGMTMLIAEKLRNNDRGFFKKFTINREKIEAFLIENKSLIGILLQYIWKTANRVQKMRDLFCFLVTEFTAGRSVSPEQAISHLGLQGKILDVGSTIAPVDFSDETKAMVYLRQALSAALVCPICKGKLDPNKSVHYDHKTPVRDGGRGSADNCDLVHPFCNTGMKS